MPTASARRYFFVLQWADGQHDDPDGTLLPSDGRANPRALGAMSTPRSRFDRPTAHDIGPIAKAFVEKTASEAHTPDEFCDRLATHVTAQADRMAFL